MMEIISLILLYIYVSFCEAFILTVIEPPKGLLVGAFIFILAALLAPIITPIILGVGLGKYIYDEYGNN